MSGEHSQHQIRVVCKECPFSQVVEREGEKPARAIIDHGQEMGHTLTMEEMDAM